LIEDAPLMNPFCNLFCCFSKVPSILALMHISSSLHIIEITVMPL
jgi:hypothetical protein